MTFALEISDTLEDPIAPYYREWITIGSFHEEFHASGTHWRDADYRAQWLEGLRRLSHENAVSCAIVSVNSFDEDCHGRWWLFYREQDIVHIHEALFFVDEMRAPFTLEEPYAAIPPRRVVTDDGERISEWHISFRDIDSFLKQEWSL